MRMIDIEEMTSLLQTAFPDGHFEIKDLTGTRDHFEGVVVTSAFAGKSLVEQHKLVYAALGNAMQEKIHAFTFRTFTPDSWSKQRRLT
jgi:stress-induced morphogen